MDYIKSLILAKENRPSPMHAIRTAVAAAAALLTARLFRLPEAYWAAITTLIVMQSTLGAELPISVQRIVGTAMGAIAGALAVTWFSANALVFGIGVQLLGLLCAALRVERNALRYAGVTLAVVMLIARAGSPWVIAAHRFIEVSLGIAVALALTALWPESQAATTAETPITTPNSASRFAPPVANDP